MDQRNRAERESLIATARELAAAAVANLDVDVERSMLLALEAVETTYRVDGTVLPEAEEVLHRALQSHRLVLTVPGKRGHFSADGSRLLVAGPRPGRPMSTRRRPPNGSRQRRRSAADPRPGRATTRPRLQRGWRNLRYLGRGARHPTFRDGDRRGSAAPERPGGALYDPQFSPDGRLLATGGPSSGGPATRHAVRRRGCSISGREGSSTSSSRSAPSRSPPRQAAPDRGFLVRRGLKAWVAGYIHDQARSGSPLGHPQVPIYNLPGQEDDVPIYQGAVGTNLTRGQTLLGHEGDVNDAAWSPDSPRVVMSSPEEVSVWDISMPRVYEPYRFRDPTNLVQAEVTVSPPAGSFTTVAYGPDSRIATGMSDGSTVVWRLLGRGAEPVLSLVGHDAAVDMVDFSPDGTRLATSSGDGTVKVWDVTPTGGGHEWLTLPGAGGLAYSPDGVAWRSAVRTGTSTSTTRRTEERRSS